MGAVQVVIRDSWIPTAITAIASISGALFGVWLATWLGRRSTLGVTRELRRLDRQDESLLEIGREAIVGKERLTYWLQKLDEEPIPREARSYNPEQVAREIPDPARTLLGLWRGGARLSVSDHVVRSIFEGELPGEAQPLSAWDGERMVSAARATLRTLGSLDARIVALVGPRSEDS